MAAPVIQFKRGLLTNLPGLRAGEPGFTTDAYDLYVGIDSTTSNNQFVGSGRYWQVNTATVGSGVKLVEGTNNGTNAVTLKSPNSLAASYTLTMPADNGDNGDVLTSDGSGNLSFSAPAASSFTIAADSGTNDTFSTGGTLTFTGGEAIDTTVSDDTITIDVEDASDSNKGAASFDSGDFSVSSGNVTLADSTNGAVLAVNGTEAEIAVSRSNGTVTVSLPDNVTVGAALTVTGKLDVNGTDHDIVGAIALDHVTSSGIVTATTFSGSGASLTDIPNSALTNNTVSFGGVSVALGSADATPAFDLSDATSLPISTGVDGLGTNVATFLATPSSSNLAAAVTGETGSGALVFGTSPTISAATLAGKSDISNANVTGVTTTATLKVGTANAVGITTVLDEDNMSSNSNTALATQQSIKAYVDSQVTAQDLDVTSDSGTIAIDLDSETLSISGTSNEIETSATGNAVTIGLPNDVTVSNNLTVSGNLYVNGSTTQVNTSQTTIEDQLLDLGMVDGSAPSSDLNKDIGVVFNYYTSSAKKAAVYWDDSTSRIVVSQDVSESSGVLTNNTGGALEVASLYVNGCSGTTDEVIGCDGNTIVITNATIDGGSF